MNSLLLALAAVLLWSTLALVGASTPRVPPFLMLGLVFSVSGVYSLVNRKTWRVPLKTLLVGTLGIFGYHFLYFRAFTLAPAVEANLINYLWPLLIVLLSPVLLPGMRLKPRHLLAGLLGLAGTVLILSGGALHIEARYLPGYLMMVGAAVVWALYSLLTRRLPPFPTGTVAAFCLISALLSFGAHLALGGSLADATRLDGRTLVILLLAGAGPMGAAFFLWDAALKRGDPRAIGALAYLTPLLSTLNLVVFGGQKLSWLAGVAMLLIVAGAVVGSSNQKPTVEQEKR